MVLSLVICYRSFLLENTQVLLRGYAETTLGVRIPFSCAAIDVPSQIQESQCFQIASLELTGRRRHSRPDFFARERIPFTQGLAHPRRTRMMQHLSHATAIRRLSLTLPPFRSTSHREYHSGKAWFRIAGEAAEEHRTQIASEEHEYESLALHEGFLANSAENQLLYETIGRPQYRRRIISAECRNATGLSTWYVSC